MKNGFQRRAACAPRQGAVRAFVEKLPVVRARLVVLYCAVSKEKAEEDGGDCDRRQGPVVPEGLSGVVQLR